jgi:hypothetical protein
VLAVLRAQQAYIAGLLGEERSPERDQHVRATRVVCRGRDLCQRGYRKNGWASPVSDLGPLGAFVDRICDAASAP